MGVRVHYTSRRASLRIATALLVGTTLAAGGALGAPTLAVPSSPTDSAATAGAGNGFEKLELIPCHIEGDRKEDIVLVDERGTGVGHRLDCPPPGSDDNVQGYLKAPFDPAPARACRDELEKKFDLRQYSTANYIEDLDEVRAALGYEKVNL